MRLLVCLSLLVCLPLAAQVAPIPSASELPGNPFFIKKTWFIGGTGSWDYLTMDPAAQLLYIAHSHIVQVVDVNSGSVVAEIPGFRNAHAIALDDTGAYGYVSDGPAAVIKVFDRSNFKIQSTIPVYCSPHSLAFEPETKLLFAICGAATETAPTPPSSRQRFGVKTSPPGESSELANTPGATHIIAIDTERNSVVADLDVAGDFRYAWPGGNGEVYVTVGAVQQTWIVNRSTTHNFFPPRIAKLDAPAIASRAQDRQGARPANGSAGEPLFIDWSHEGHPGSLVDFLPLPKGCESPQALGADSKDRRLFVACQDQRFMVLNSNSGEIVAALTTGPGDDVVGYDADRALIYVANGGGYGSITIIRQDATTDSYAVIQNLATGAQAHTLAVDSSSGDVYLVSDYTGADLTKPHGIGTMKMVPVPGSFQVMVVGH